MIRGRSTEQEELDQLHRLSQLVESESTRLLTMEITPFANPTYHRRHHDGGSGGGGDGDGDGGDADNHDDGDGTLLTDLKNQVRHSLVQAKIRSQPEVVNAVRLALIN